MNKIRLNRPTIIVVVIHASLTVLRFASSSSYAIKTNNKNNCHLDNDDERHGDEDGRRLIHLRQAITDGRLSQARRLALELLIHFPDCERTLSRIYNEAVDDEIAYIDSDNDDDNDNNHDDESINRYLNLVQQRATEDEDDDRLVTSSSSVVGTPLPDDDDRRCWDGVDVVSRSSSRDDHRSARSMASEAWDRCCSRLPLTGGGAESSRTVNGGDVMSSLASSAKPLGQILWRETTTTDDNNNENDGLACFDAFGTPRCCDFFLESLSYLRLPALREISLRIRLPSDDNDNGSDAGNDNDDGNSREQQQRQRQHEPLEVEQNGFLRPFDVSGMLWPSGYLLALCVAAPVACGIPELITAAMASQQRGDGTTTTTISTPVALELGAGIGVPSIALAKSLSRLKGLNASGTSPLVIATDNSPNALMLMMANCRSTRVAVAHADYNDDRSIQKLKEKLETYHHIDNTTSNSSKELGFHIILGSSLQSLFDDTENQEAPLWILLDKLLSKDNPQAIALLAHSKIQPINTPMSNPDRKSAQQLLFVRVGRVSGDALRMLTRDGASSDFEISVFRRAPIVENRNLEIENEL